LGDCQTSRFCRLCLVRGAAIVAAPGLAAAEPAWRDRAAANHRATTRGVATLTVYAAVVAVATLAVFVRRDV
jgi:hypothetical protein